MKSRSTILFLLFSALFCLDQQAQIAGNYLYNNPQSFNGEHAQVKVNTPLGSTVNLQAQVMMNVRATSYTAIFAISQFGRDVVEVDSMMSQRLAQVRFAMSQMGIPEGDIHIDAVSMVPTYAYQLEEKKFSKRATEIPTGFEMKKNIHVLFRKHDLMDQIISQMAFAEIYDMVKVEYNIDGVQSYYEELRKAALEIITSKENTYGAMHLHLDVYSLADGFNCTYPMERYKNYTAYNAGSSPIAVNYARNNNNIIMQGKNNTLTMNNDQYYQQFVVQTAEKNKTIFYDRMPYNQFDKVINADMEEPSIQLFYDLQVAYTMITEVQYNAQQEQIAAQKKLEQETKQQQLNQRKRYSKRRLQKMGIY